MAQYQSDLASDDDESSQKEKRVVNVPLRYLSSSSDEGEPLSSIRKRKEKETEKEKGKEKEKEIKRPPPISINGMSSILEDQMMISNLYFFME